MKRLLISTALTAPLLFGAFAQAQETRAGAIYNQVFAARTTTQRQAPQRPRVHYIPTTPVADDTTRFSSDPAPVATQAPAPSPPPSEEAAPAPSPIANKARVDAATAAYDSAVNEFVAQEKRTAAAQARWAQTEINSRLSATTFKVPPALQAMYDAKDIAEAKMLKARQIMNAAIDDMDLGNQ